MNKILFLDRDGVLNIEKQSYICKVEDFEINEGAVPFLLRAIEKGYKLVVITNQGGIAKGLYNHRDIHEIHQKMKLQFSEQGIVFDDIFYCPHHDDYGKCLCRKPGSLLIERALHRYEGNKNECYMIGDRSRDTEAASNAGITGILVDSNTNLDYLIERLV